MTSELVVMFRLNFVIFRFLIWLLYSGVRLTDGRHLYTSPCGIRTKWPSGWCTPLYIKPFVSWVVHISKFLKITVFHASQMQYVCAACPSVWFFDVFLTSFNTKNIKIGDPRMECYTYMYQTMNKLQVYTDKI